MQSKPGRASRDSFPSSLTACLASVSLVSWALKWRQCIQGKDITSKLLSINRPGCCPEVARSAVRIWLNGHLRIPTCAWCGDYSCYPKQRSFLFSQLRCSLYEAVWKTPVSWEGLIYAPVLLLCDDDTASSRPKWNQDPWVSTGIR